MCINSNNVIISNNYGRLQEVMLLFKILIGTQFEHATLKSFTALPYT
jgi:hypothetical protein